MMRLGRHELEIVNVKTSCESLREATRWNIFRRRRWINQVVGLGVEVLALWPPDLSSNTFSSLSVLLRGLETNGRGRTNISVHPIRQHACRSMLTMHSFLRLKQRLRLCMGRAKHNVFPTFSCSLFLISDPSRLQQKTPPQGLNLTKVQIRAFSSSYKLAFSAYECSSYPFFHIKAF